MKELTAEQIAAILEIGADALNAEAKNQGAKYGGGAVTIVIPGGRPRSEEVALDDNMENAFPSSEVTGKDRRNYILTALQKIWQALRRKKDSTSDESQIIKGEVAFEGGTYYKSVDEVEFVAAWSSMTSEKDKIAADAAVATMVTRYRHF